MDSSEKLIDEADSTSVLFAHKAAGLLKEARVQEARALCEQGIKRFPLYAQGHFIMARCYQAVGLTDDAKAEFERTLLYDPSHIQAKKALAYFYYKEKMRSTGNKLLLDYALYDPLNDELNKFLKEEKLFQKLYPSIQLKQSSVEELEFREIQEEADREETFDIEEKSEPEIIIADETEEEEIKPDAEVEPSVREVLLDESQTIEEENSETEEALSVEDEEKLLPALEGELLQDNELHREAGQEEPAVEDVENIADRQEEQAVVSEGLNEQELIEMPMNTEENAEEPLREEISDEPPEEEPVSSENMEDTKVDLSQFDNTQDDFSTVMNDLFQPEGIVEDEKIVEIEPVNEVENEPEQMAEERPILDTTIIFRDDDQQKASEEELKEIPSETFNPLPSIEDDLQSDDEMKRIEEEIDALDNTEVEVEEVTEIAEKEIQPEVEKAAVNGEKKEDIEYDAAQAARLDDESVNIEEIMENPSLLTPTFGEILIAQKKFEDAHKIFEELLRKDPDNPRLQRKINFLDKILAVNR